MSDMWLDGDGYPTEETLKRVRGWDWKDKAGLLAFLKSVWSYAEWGWHEEDAVDGVLDKKVRRYNISTAGWSGNEDLIEAMEENHMVWLFCWVQSRRGGHYIFEVAE